MARFRTGKLTVRGAYFRMADKPLPRLLEVKVAALKPEWWEWQVCESDTPIMTGHATSRETAQMDGDNALFLLLSKGTR